MSKNTIATIESHGNIIWEFSELFEYARELNCQLLLLFLP
jgi:hypothetical protein